MMTILLVLLEDVVSHKNIRNTRYQRLCVYYTYLYNISRDFSSSHHLELKCMGGLFFQCHPYTESTTVLSDECMYK